MTNLKILLVVLFFINQNINAYMPKEGNITAMLGPFVSRTDFQGSATHAKSPNFGGFGLIVQGDINSYGALEIAMMHFHKIYLREQQLLSQTEKIEQVHITMGYRYWMNPYFSTSLAFSSSYGIGDPQVVHSDFASSSQFDTSARDPVEYGFEFSLQSELWQNDRYSVIADGRYNLSVTNKEDEKGNHYGLFVGLKYLIQEK